MSEQMQFTSSGKALTGVVSHLFVAGWTGRNKSAVDHHISELHAIGVAPPTSVPLFYRVSPTLLTLAENISVLGAECSGEVEPLLLNFEGRIWLGLGSDHTDRNLETVSVARAKQACLKPVAREVWAWEEVADHLDELILRSWIIENGEEALYQEGTLSNIIPLQDLMADVDFRDGSAMLCGTIPALGGVRPSGDFRMEMLDPFLNRSINMRYQVKELPVVS
ncbi:MAG: DUF2848 domain-containing protein [Cohaesibacteraceae bacterium]|nr:DUF2848 domain-containing protein [Cohaesibacteraceae bacterium]